MILKRIFPFGQNTAPAVSANAETTTPDRIDTSAGLLAYIQAYSAMNAYEVTAVLRAVDLVSSGVGMLPMRVVGLWDRRTIRDHSLTNILRFEPNAKMSAFDFKRLMEKRCITEGDSFAHVMKAGGRVMAINTLERSRVKVVENNSLGLDYEYTRPDGSKTVFSSSEIWHLRDLPADEKTGLSRHKLARRAIETSRAAEEAQRNIFKFGALAKGMITAPGKLSDKAFVRLKADLKDFHGVDSSNRIMLGEEGMGYADFGMSGRDAQTNEGRAHQIEEIARVFGIPRPLLMMDDTSWGSGIEQLATLFVRFGLAPRLTAWEQSGRRVLFSEVEKQTLDLDIDERLLLRGSLKDQAEYFAKASGSGGHRAWLTQDEIRHQSGEPPLTDAQRLKLEPINVA